jgi:hypothetical protein
MIGFVSRTKRLWLGPALVVGAASVYTLHVEDLNKPNPEIPLIFRPETVGKLLFLQ